MPDSMDFSLAEAYFHISPKGVANSVYSVCASDLLQSETTDEVLRQCADLLRALNLHLPVSFVGLTFFNVCATLQLFLAQYNRILDLSLDNLVFQLGLAGDQVHGGFRIVETRWDELPEEGEQRKTVLLNRLTAFYQRTITPVLEAIAARAGVKPDLIWNQFGARMAYLLDYMHDREQREAVRNRFVGDYALLSGELSPSVFNRRKNPFAHTPRYLDSPYQPGEKIMMRSSCCMYYCRIDGEKCYNCPRLTERQREEMRLKIEASQKHASS
jgi:ferric iron reductase protein FhuF